jgi:thioredoxin-related protein
MTHRITLLAGLLLAALAVQVAAAPEEDEPLSITLVQENASDYEFSDKPTEGKVAHPAWFQHTDDLRGAVIDARKRDKTGLILYFGQEKCAYCDALIKTSLNREDVSSYIQKNFDVFEFDILSDKSVVTVDGRRMTQREFATVQQTNLTPALLFYDPSGKEVLRLRGYYPPYIITAALDYMIAEGYKHSQFRQYLERAKASQAKTTSSDIQRTQNARFMQPPLLLSAAQRNSDRILVVIFDQADCHACDILYNELLPNTQVDAAFAQMDVAQLELWSDTPVLTPTGEKTTARQWAEQMGLFYSPTLVFFDTSGREIFRVDSVVRLYRLNAVLDYIQDQGYLSYPNDLQGWFFSKRMPAAKR